MNNIKVELKELCNKYIDNITSFDLETKKQIDEIDKIITPDNVENLSEQEIDELGSKRYSLFIKGLNKKYRELYIFRINNFNQEAESILEESKVFEAFQYHGITCERIDKLNFKDNGTIEDYITFFNEEINKNLDLGIIWEKFLSSIKDEISPLQYDTWFEQAKLLEYKNGICKVIVPSFIYKEHLLNRYYDLITSKLSDIFEEPIKVEVYNKNEI